MRRRLPVRVSNRSTFTQRGSIRFYLAPRTYTPWGARVVSPTKSLSRKYPPEIYYRSLSVNRYSAGWGLKSGYAAWISGRTLRRMGLLVDQRSTIIRRGLLLDQWSNARRRGWPLPLDQRSNAGRMVWPLSGPCLYQLPAAACLPRAARMTRGCGACTVPVKCPSPPIEPCLGCVATRPPRSRMDRSACL